MTVIVDPTQIVTTQEYLDDLSMLTEVIVDSLGQEEEINSENPFVYAVASQLSQIRYLTRHVPELKDIDLSPYLDLLKGEVGVGIPFSSVFPTLEFLRENKRWFGHKGVETIYRFIGALIGSPIRLRYPKDLLFRTNHLRSKVSGDISPYGGPLPWEQSSQARIRDGIFWSQYVFVLDVDQVQNFGNLQDLIGLLESVHPAGLKEYIELSYKFLVHSDFPDPDVLVNYAVLDYYVVRATWPTISNGLKTNTGGSLTSMHNSTLFGSGVWIVENPLLLVGYASQNITTSTSFIVDHYDLNNDNMIFSRLIGQGTGTNYGDYTRVFAYNDPLVFQHVRTNSGLGQYTVGSIGLLDLNRLGLVALDHELDNPRLDWMYHQVSSRTFIPEIQYGADQPTTLDDTFASVSNSPELSSDYGVIVSTSWYTTSHVENAQSMGFDIVFSTPSPGDDFDYLMMESGNLEFTIINVPLSAEEITIPVPPTSDPSAQLFVTSNWSTSFYFTDYSGGEVDLAIQTPDSATAELYGVWIDPPNSGQILLSLDDTTSGTIPCPVAAPYLAFALPSWNTQVKIVKTPTDFEVFFTVPAPSGGIISWGVREA